MIKQIQTSGHVAALFAGVVVTFAMLLALPSNAGALQANSGQKAFQTLKAPSAARVADKLKTPGKRVKKECNGQTTTECCSGLSYCGCFYFPGKSDDTHPTSCTSNPPPKD